MRDVDPLAGAVHLPDHVPAERREPAVAGGLRLDVAQLVDPVVRQLDGADPSLVYPRASSAAVTEGHSE